MAVETGIEGGNAAADQWSAWEYCRCGALLWAVDKRYPDPRPYLPRLGNTVTCHNCGATYKRRPFPDYPIWWLKSGAKRHIIRPWRRAWRRFWSI